MSARKRSSSEARIRLLPRRSRLIIVLIALLIGLEAGFSCFVPLSVRYFVDILVPAKDRPGMVSLALMVAGALLVSVLAGLVRDYVFAKLRSRSLGTLRHNMFRRLQSLSMQFHSERDDQEMTERFSTDLASIETAFSLAISWGMLPVILSLLCTGLMLWLDWRVGLAAVILWPWAILAPRAMTPKSARIAGEAHDREKHLLSVLEETMSAQPVIRAFAIEHLGAAAFRKRNEALMKSIMSAGLWAAFADRFSGTGILLEQVLVLGLGMWLVFEKSMTIGTMVALQMLAVVLSNGLMYLVEYLPVLVTAQEALGAIQRSMREPGAVIDMPDAKVLPPFSTDIVFSNVSFNFGTKETAAANTTLERVSIRIPKGSYAAFVGPSGAGKSAMLSLLMRFHDVRDGRISIDGHDLTQITQASLRAQIGVVMQDGYVFNSTIRENIRMGRPTATEEAVADAARAAGMTEFINSQPKGLDTPAGGSGVWISAEMTQRLALARAILRNPPILLLDEIASSLDPAEELALNATIAELAKTTTVISATHRLASVQGASHIFVFDQGRVVEQGTHFELMAKEGVYASLWRRQAGFRFSADGRHVDVDAQRLKSIPILEKLDETILSELAPYFATETFEPGQNIVTQNDPGDKFYIIARGSVEVWLTDERTGKSLCVNTLSDGDFFGEITLITGFPRTATIRSVAVTTCISLERGQFTRLIDRFPDLKRELSEIAVQRLRESSAAAAAGAE